MEQIYLAFVDTPGFFASIIRRVIGIPYVHVVRFVGKFAQQLGDYTNRRGIIF